VARRQWSGRDLADRTTLIAQSAVGANPGSTCHEKAAADFNGDGMADIPSQNDNGQAAIWLMNGQNSIAETAVGAIQEQAGMWFRIRISFSTSQRARPISLTCV
jgi:hypothetical protein